MKLNTKRKNSPKSVRVLIKLGISIEISAVSTILGKRWMCRMIRPLMYMLTVLAIVGRLWDIVTCHVSRLQMTLSRWTLSRISTKGTVLKIQCLVILHIWKNWRVISFWKKSQNPLKTQNSLDHRFLDGDQMVQKRRNVQVIEKIGQYKYLETDYLI